MVDFILIFLGIPALFGLCVMIVYSCATWIPEFVAEAIELFKDDGCEASDSE